MSNFKNREIREIAQFNPSEKMAISTVAKKIPMGHLREYQRKITGYEISEYKSGSKFRNGDVLLAKITPCLENGKTAFVDILDKNEVAFGSTEFIVLRAKENSDKEYLYYLARSPAFRKKAISCMEGTSGRKRVNEGALKLQELPIPDKYTQQKIAAVLSALDAKIECNSRISAELEAIAKTLYDYWFVQFDFPDQNGQPYKSFGGKMVYNDTLKREIPEGWHVTDLGNKIAILNGFAFKSSDYCKEGIFVLRTKNFNENQTIDRLSDDVYLPFGFVNSHKSYLCKPFDYHLIMVGASVGNRGLIYEHLLPALRNQNMWCFRPKGNEVGSAFVKQTVDALIEEKKNYSSGSAREFYTKGNFREHQIVLPPIPLLVDFEEKCMTIMELQSKRTSETHQLIQLRDWLLPMLMNGQVTVA